MKTDGIMGLCPLACVMPMRCTCTLDKEQQVFKFTRCVLVGWELHDIDKDMNGYLCGALDVYRFLISLWQIDEDVRMIAAERDAMLACI